MESRMLGHGGSGGLRVGLLGPLEVRLDEAPVRVPGDRLAVVLAALALSAGRTVTVAELADRVWPDQPPQRVRGSLQTIVSRLRRLLGADTIRTRASGYVLDVDSDRVDVLRFRRLVAMARSACDPARARELLDEALGLWRGEPLSGLGSEALQRGETPHLVDARLGALELRASLDLAAGRHAEVAAELAETTARHPLREPLWHLRLTALARDGRRAEAIEVYHQLRTLLREELGVDPSRELQALFRELLAAEPADGLRREAAAAVPAPVPRELPLPPADFTGRAVELAALQRLLGGADPAAPIAALAGMAGAGKSVLAIHAAHQLAAAGAFPDGQLYVNLQGAAPGQRPLQPLGALHRMLRSLGVRPESLPADVEEAAARFRSLVAGRRLLVLLDDASGPEQVRPLLPGSPTCRVLVTSRQDLTTLEGGQVLRLGVLPDEQAVELLERIAGRQRVGAEPEAASALVGWCGRLPLAIRIAGARLAARPAWSVAELAGRLADATARLEELRAGELAVRATFRVSLRALAEGTDPVDQAAAAAFPLLSLPDGPDLGVAASARLLDVTEARARTVLERLVDAHLLEAHGSGRYRFHDLLRLYAREHAVDRHEAPERAAALVRVMSLYTATAWSGLAQIRPYNWRLETADPRWAAGGRAFGDPEAALRWLDAERDNLLAAIAQAARPPDGVPSVPPELAGQLARAMFGFFVRRSYGHDQLQAGELALEVARRTGDRVGQAVAHVDIGVACQLLGRDAEAVAATCRGLALLRELGLRHGQAASLNNLGRSHLRQRQHEEAIACVEEALAINREVGDPEGAANAVINLGVAYRQMGRYEDAIACLREGMPVNDELRAESLHELGAVYRCLGRTEEAVACLEESLAISRQREDRWAQAATLHELGVLHGRTGEPARAVAALRESVAIFDELGADGHRYAPLRDLGDLLEATAGV
jgi:DNA-binding SARP family transcriptional activator